MKLNYIKKRLPFIVSLLFFIFSLLMIFSPYKGVIVVTNSMMPTIPQWSLVFTKPIDLVKIDDIIIFDSPYERDLIIHRVVDINSDSELIITKGDLNPTNDLFPIAYDQVISGYLFHVPYIGSIILFIRNHALAICMLVTVGYLIKVYQMHKKHTKKSSKTNKNR